MHHPSKPYRFSMARLEITCDWHGRHSLLIGGDAALVWAAADHLKHLYERDGFKTEVSMTEVDFPAPGEPDVEHWDC